MMFGQSDIWWTKGNSHRNKSWGFRCRLAASL